MLRRKTGGIAIRAGAGTAYVALLLPSPSTLMPCGMDRFVNRHVRGVVKALTKMGAPAQYLGRDFVSVLHRPAAWVGWDREASGTCRLELLIAVSEPFALPAGLDGYAADRARPTLGGKSPITLMEAIAASGGAADEAAIHAKLAERLPAALASVPASLGGTGEPTFPIVANDDASAIRVVDATTSLVEATDPSGDAELAWSRPVEDAIGFVEAGVRLRPDGTISRARIAGDFCVERAGLATLEGALPGRPATPEAIGAAIDAALGPGRYVIEGLASLRTLQVALLDAVTRAAS